MANIFIKIGFILNCFNVLLVCGCGTNFGKSQETITPEQQARELMNLGDYKGAIDILQPLVADEPNAQERKPLLAAAYAGYVGVDVLGVLKNMLSSAEGASKSVFTIIYSLIPETTYKGDLEYMKSSISVLTSIPAADRKASADNTYGLSAEIQLILYQSIYATMLLNYYVGLSGTIDLDTIKNLSAADVAKIIDALRGAAASGQTGTASSLSNKVAKTVDGIDDASGSTDQERLASYINTET